MPTKKQYDEVVAERDKYKAAAEALALPVDVVLVVFDRRTQEFRIDAGSLPPDMVVSLLRMACDGIVSQVAIQRSKQKDPGERSDDI